MILAGETVLNRNVALLATLLDGDELATKLARGVGNENSIVALSRADRTRIVAVLTDPPGGLAGLRTVLVKQLKKLQDSERRDEQLRQWRAAR